eukprot:UN24306
MPNKYWKLAVVIFLIPCTQIQYNIIISMKYLDFVMGETDNFAAIILSICLLSEMLLINILYIPIYSPDDIHGWTAVEESSISHQACTPGYQSVESLNYNVDDVEDNKSVMRKPSPYNEETGDR